MDGWDPEPTSARYDVAQVCRRGHLISGYGITRPETRAAHCDKCGTITIDKCEHCGAPIRGTLHTYNSTMPIGEPPAHCYACGRAFPWREEQIVVADALAAEAVELDDPERIQLRDSLVEIGTESPATTLAAARIKRLLKKLGPDLRASVYRFAVDVSSEIGKRLLTGE
jgi:hypothetical protein